MLRKQLLYLSPSGLVPGLGCDTVARHVLSMHNHHAKKQMLCELHMAAQSSMAQKVELLTVERKTMSRKV